MAATVSSPWGKPGAWALDAEEYEAELQRQNSQQSNNGVSSGGSIATDFPSLATAAAAPKQPKKKKNQTLSLAEFSTYSSEPKSLTPEEIFNLPTGPRERSAEELDRSRLGGGFKSYPLNYRNGDDSSNSRWGGSNSRALNRDSSREFLPSRADEIDDWSKTKKTPVGNGYERRERGSFFESHSRADESDSWTSNKTTEPRRFERRGNFDSLSRDRPNSRGSSAADSDSWGRRKEETNETVTARPRLLLQPRTLPLNNGDGAAAKPKGSSPFGEARPREEVLAEKGKDWKEIDEKLESMKFNNGNKETEKADGRDAARSAWRNRGASGDDRFERSWRKPENVDSGSRPQSADTTDNGHATENEIATENGLAEGN